MIRLDPAFRPFLGLDKARAIAGRFLELIVAQCDQVLVVGSIRRKRPEVRDIDLVAIPKTEMRERPTDLFGPVPVSLLHDRVRELLRDGTLKARVKRDGKTMVGEGVAFVEFEGTPIDVYYATPETWGCLVLIRTGSKEHNIALVTRAKGRGWILHADGRGVWDSRTGGKRIDARTEESVFAVLGLPWRNPEEREVPA